MTKRRLLFIVLGLVVAIQFVPVHKNNPPVTTEAPGPPEVRAVFERVCFDCHSNQTDWPWYSHVAPVSWLVAHDVEEAREHLNFSEWDSYPAEKQHRLREEVWEEVEEGEMPLWFYTPLHLVARLSDKDKELIRLWSRQDTRSRPLASEGAPKQRVRLAIEENDLQSERVSFQQVAAHQFVSPRISNRIDVSSVWEDRGVNMVSDFVQQDWSHQEI
jgi:hypothetical protein